MQGIGAPRNRVAVREPTRKNTEEMEQHSRACVQERPWRGAQGEGVAKRVDVCGCHAGALEPRRFPEQGTGQKQPARRRKSANAKIHICAISEGGGWKRSWQVLIMRAAEHTLQTGMIGGPGSIGGSAKVKGSVRARLPRCCPEALRVMNVLCC
jgi:hypothetical protein